jgi:predicted nucleic acid-binding protein
VVQELNKALRSKLRLPAARARAIVDFVSSEATQTIEHAAPALVQADPADARVLGEALAAKVALFVTGDAALLELGTIETMEIVSPRGFWEKMKKV